MMSKPELVYFNARGRAEVIRLLFAEADFEYVDTRFRDHPQALYKNRGELPFDQVPILKIDGLILAQSQAILRFLSRKLGLEGQNLREASHADMIACAAEDLRQRCTCALAADNLERTSRGDRFPSSKVPQSFLEVGEVTTSASQIFTGTIGQTTVPKWSEYFERALSDHGQEWMCGTTFTYADLSVFDVFNMFTNSEADFLQKFPLLKAHLKRVTERPRIAKWLRERPQTPI